MTLRCDENGTDARQVESHPRFSSLPTWRDRVPGAPRSVVSAGRHPEMNPKHFAKRQFSRYWQYGAITSDASDPLRC